MSRFNLHKKMLERVAIALGNDLLDKVAFVGGCTTGLHLSDQLTKESVRHTMDVDLIIPVISNVEWLHFQSALEKRGFTHDLVNEMPACAMQLGELRVDFMPQDEHTLGFTNRWYSEALEKSNRIELGTIHIKIVTPVYFLATKLEAFKGRGNDDVLGSQDVEDILTLFNGRPEIVQEVADANNESPRLL